MHNNTPSSKIRTRFTRVKTLNFILIICPQISRGKIFISSFLTFSQSHTAYLAILKEELVQATIAIAYCSALLRQTLGACPEQVEVGASGNILKNVQSVVVSNAGGLHSLPAAVAAGVVADNADAQLQVISHVTEEQKAEIAQYIKNTHMTISCIDTPCIPDIQLTGKTSGDTAFIRIANNHTNVTHIEKMGKYQSVMRYKWVQKRCTLEDSTLGKKIIPSHCH